MVINRSHIPWLLFTLFASAFTAALYWLRFHPDSFPLELTLPRLLQDGSIPRNTIGGTRVGLLFGTAALLIFLFAAALGARKKKPLLRIGRVELWLKAHIWFTILTIPLVGFHCGWSWGSPHTTMLLILYIIVMVTGFFGLAMQQFMPALMKERLPQEVVYEQIPHIRKRLIEVAEAMRKDVAKAEEGAAPKEKKADAVEPTADDITSADTLCEFLDAEVLPYLRLKNGANHRLGRQRESDDSFRLAKLNVAPNWFPRVEEMQAWCDERRRTDLQTRLQHWLHGWLIIHVPVSLFLIVVTLWHAVVAVKMFVVNP